MSHVKTKFLARVSIISQSKEKYFYKCLKMTKLHVIKFKKSDSVTLKKKISQNVKGKERILGKERSGFGKRGKKGEWKIIIRKEKALLRDKR